MKWRVEADTNTEADLRLVIKIGRCLDPLAMQICSACDVNILPRHMRNSSIVFLPTSFLFTADPHSLDLKASEQASGPSISPG